MSLSRRTFALMLAMTPGVGGKSVTRVMTRDALLGRDPEDFLKLSPEALKEEYRLTPKAITHLIQSPKETWKQVEEFEKKLTGLDVTLVVASDAHYPTLIEEMDPDPPGVLFLYGNTRLLESRTFCVLSSRNARAADLDLIEKLTEEGVLAGEVLVSGHDRPEYQRSAIVPLRWGSPRILCLDRGLFNVLGPNLRDEAFRAARLWRYEFDPKTDLVVSPFRPEADFVGINNKVRDRVVACLSKRLDFVHVAEGGNMERLIKLAVKAGRATRISDRNIGWREYVQLGAEAIKD